MSQETTFISKIHPEMNPFWKRIERAFGTLPFDPTSSYKGFCFADYNAQQNMLRVETIGIINPEWIFSDLNSASRRVTETLIHNKKASRDFLIFEPDCELENPGIGAIRLGAERNEDCAGVAGVSAIPGHISTDIGEAVALLWITVRHMCKGNSYSLMNNQNFWLQLLEVSKMFHNSHCPTNQEVITIATLMTKN